MTMLERSIYAKINMLPLSKMEELMDFVEFLLNKEAISKVVEQTRKPIFGCAKGKFKMASDFDAPLDDFNEYMP